MDKHYDPHEIEEKWYQLWMEKGLFAADPDRPAETYCIMIPPPNVTGILHIGHALNNTIQDILIRCRRMQGRNVLWLPGTDHAGIATQNVVERALLKDGISREDLGRDAFVKRVWEWREEYGGTIINQLKRLGASCDWDRERFTMDEGLSDAVTEVFIRLYEKGLVYKGNYIVNWCSRCETALSDEESQHANENGRLYYIRYEVREDGSDEKEHIVVATTRPETLLGDVAVAVNPNDERYAHLADKKLILPVLGRELVVIKDDFVNPEFGTGVVKVTPAHDPNDFDMGQRHDLTPINVMNGDGTMNENTGPYEGMDRFECRKKILKQLDSEGLLEKIEEHVHAVGHCYRCDTVVEPRLSPQWFVKMKPLAEPAIKVVKEGKVEFVPQRWTKVYLEWMENIRDWCISRQIWWGHRIPVFTCGSCEHVWAAKGSPDTCPECGKSDAITQDEDVLDTWFSSWLWPFSTLGWPKEEKELSAYYPTNDLVTASEIIFFWVARMVMAGLEFMDDIPFSKVYIHGTVRDSKGLKMSKSLGNSIDPLTIIDEFSADALRFSLMMITATGQDVYLSKDKFEIGRNFGTKLWNAARFMNLQAERIGGKDEWTVGRDGLGDIDAGLLSPDDKYILSKLQEAIKDFDESIEKFRFNDAAHVLYEFVWHQYCDWYVEYTKGVVGAGDEARSRQVLRIMHHVFSTSIRLLHPMMPFITEELWHVMEYAKLEGDEESWVMTSAWPTALSPAELKEMGIDDESVSYIDDKHDLIRVARTLKSDYGIVPSQKVAYLIKPDSPDMEKRLLSDRDSIAGLLNAKSLEIGCDLDVGEAMPSGVSTVGNVYMPLEGVVDIEAETKRLSSQMEKVESGIRQVASKLDNVAFVSKAPQEVVDQQKERKKTLLEEREKIQHLLETLGGL
jgi:valyl-tRNA synthetase